MSEIERYVGVVKWFNNKVGYGFITCLEKEYQNRDIFVHHSALIGDNSNQQQQQFKYLVQGEYVEFQLKHDVNNQKHPFSAQHVTGIKNGKLLFSQRTRDTRHKKPFPI
jgi:cold shock CspA family protein